MLRIGMLSFVVCLFAGSLSYGQDFPQPGPEHKKLQEVVGTWDAVMDMNGQTSKATAVYTSICGGMWLASDFEGDFGGLNFQGHGLDGYDLTKKEYVSIWVDSMSSAPMQLRGKFDDKKQLVMTGESIQPDGTRQKVKTTTVQKDKDHMSFKMYMVNGGDEQLAFTIEYTRKK